MDSTSFDHKIYTGTAVAQIDRLAIERFGTPSYSLMCEAGAAAFALLQWEYAHCAYLLVMCGTGNNGGDGYVLAKLALKQGLRVQVLAHAPPRTNDAQRAQNEYLDIGGIVLAEPPTTLPANALIVDALLGTGINDAPRAPLAEFIKWANQQNCARLAIDIPSGIDSDTGHVWSTAFRAHTTQTYIALKLGLLTGPAANYAGNIHLHPLTLPAQAREEVDACATALRVPQVAKRAPDSHKGTFGHAAVVGGSSGMLGAGILCSEAALRSGCGKVHLISDHPQVELATVARPEIMTATRDNANAIIAQASALAIGPGLGKTDYAQECFQHVINLNKPTVIDADALYLLREYLAPDLPPFNPKASDSQLPPTAALPTQLIVTPHPGEAAYLLNTTTQQIQSNRLAAATRIAELYQAVCVLKGHGTLICSAGTTAQLCRLGNAGMATAGSGDVLTGILVSLLAQGWCAPEAAQLGVWLHSRAADIVIQSQHPASLIASDISNNLFAAWREIA